jgi:serine/threonine-protein kinase
MERLQSHVASCPSCGATLRALSGDVALATTAHGGTDPSAPMDATARALARAGFAVRARGASVGRYLVLSLIGSGGMGDVYEAYDPQLDRRVALKLLRTASASVSARERLVREARALAQLSHPNVVHVYDVGEHEDDVFIAMELIDGQSLDAWCRGPAKPGWHAVVAAYLEAARGLAAAHEKGLVHRDVKPSNLLHGRDGRVRVVDFGLVTSEREQPEVAEPYDVSAHGGDARLTATGAMLGTPLYMAPEQFTPSGASAASDQYGLCAGLYEGLYGALSFELGADPAQRSLLDIIVAKESPPRPPPAGSTVPPQLFDILARGLAPAPADRYPSMDALADALALASEPRRRTALWGIGAAAVAALLLAVGGAGWARGAFADPCAHPEKHLAGVWDEAAKQRVHAALLQSGRPYASDTAARIAALLDRQAASYASMRGEVCTEARTQGQSAATLALREACLERRRSQMQALTTLLAERSDPRVLDRGVQAAAELTPVAGCADIDALTSRVRPPEDPALRARVGTVQPRIDRLEALYNTGQYKVGLEEGEDTLAQATAVPYPLLAAQAKAWLGLMHANLGDYEQAKAMLRESAALGAQAGDDVLVARSWARVLYITGLRQQHLDEAGVLRTLGPTLLARANDDRARATWLSAEGLILGEMGRYDEARAAGEQAVALAEKSVGPEHTFVADTLINLSSVYLRTDDFTEALRLNERALDIRTKLLGPDHPLVGGVLQNIAVEQQSLGDLRPAISTYERALAIVEGNSGPQNPDVATILDSLASARDDVGEWDDALPMSERALAIREAAFGPDSNWVALSAGNLGEIVLHRGDVARAGALFEQAVAAREKASGPDHPELAEPLADLARVRVEQGKLDEARPLLDRARAMRDKPEYKDDPDLARVYEGMAEIATAQHKADEAVADLEKALAVRGAKGKPNALAETKLALADALWLAGTDRSRARALAEEARAAYQQIGHRPGLAATDRWLASHR